MADLFGRTALAGLLATALHSPLLAQAVAPAAAQPAAPAPAQPGQTPPAPSDDQEDDQQDIVITGRLPGAVVGDIKPEVTLNRNDVRAIGAGSIADLLTALGPQVRSDRGRGGGGFPVILLNGQRISSFAEIRDLPPEAIDRVEVLAEEVALKYGYRADQRVVNFVLRPRFRAITAEVEGGIATQGGRAFGRANGTLLRIDRQGRFTLNSEYRHDAPLFESERNVIEQNRLFDLTGNIGPAGANTQIDPALSALAGQPVTVAGVPASAAQGAPALGAFATTANQPNNTDIARYRTLLPETDRLTANATLNRTIGKVSATINARLEGANSQSQLGLPSARVTIPAGDPFSPFGSDVTLFRYFNTPGPLGRDNETRNGHIGLVFNGALAPWRWSATANYDRTKSLTLTDTGLDTTALQARLNARDPALNPFGPIPGDLLVVRDRDRAESIIQNGSAEAVANGPLLHLPAGNVSSTLKTGFELRRLDSWSLRSGLFSDAHLSRDSVNAQANLDIPIASRRTKVLQAIGDLSFNLNAEVEHLSDFGTLRTLGGGFHWSPIQPLSIIGSVTDEKGAPGIEQLGNPVIQTPNVPVFDFTRGETVLVTQVEGGNPALRPDHRRVWKLGMNLRPISDQDLSITADFLKERISNPIAGFPIATPQLEAAFPDRFQRDNTGRLVRIDTRPVNFAESNREQLRWGINFSHALKQKPPSQAQIAAMREQFRRRFPNGFPGQQGQGQPGQPGQAGPRPQGAGPGGPGGQGRPGGGGGGFGGRGGGFGGGGPGGFANGGRVQLALYHTWHFRDDILIAPGGPKLDLLNGSATGFRGGQARHELEFQAGVFRNGMGARLTANWQSGTRVIGALNPTSGTSQTLFFSPFTTVNLRLFADIGSQPGLVLKHPWLRGTRISLALDNLLDTHQQVRDQLGATPLSYQPGLIDPVGRSIRLSIRKLFF